MVGTGGEAGNSWTVLVMLFVEDDLRLVKDLVLSTASTCGDSTEAVSFASSNSS